MQKNLTFAFAFGILFLETEGCGIKAKNMSLCGLFAALLAICAWICVPVADTVITLQTFALFLCLRTLGGKRGFASTVVYLLLGAVGLPVFSGFRGGIGTLLGVTGGYLTGFLFTAVFYWLLTALAGNTPRVQLLALIGGLLLCYAFGSLWFYHGYLSSGSPVSMGLLLTKCVLPYLLPDGIKLVLAWQLSKKLRRFV